MTLGDVMHDSLFDVMHMRFCLTGAVSVSVFDIFFVSLDVLVFVSAFCSFCRTDVTACSTRKYRVNSLPYILAYKSRNLFLFYGAEKHLQFIHGLSNK